MKLMFWEVCEIKLVLDPLLVMASLGKPLEIALADGISRRHGGVLGIVFN